MWEFVPGLPRRCFASRCCCRVDHLTCALSFGGCAPLSAYRPKPAPKPISLEVRAPILGSLFALQISARRIMNELTIVLIHQDEGAPMVLPGFTPRMAAFRPPIRRFDRRHLAAAAHEPYPLISIMDAAHRHRFSVPVPS